VASVVLAVCLTSCHGSVDPALVPTAQYPFLGVYSATIEERNPRGGEKSVEEIMKIRSDGRYEIWFGKAAQTGSWTYEGQHLRLQYQGLILDPNKRLSVPVAGSSPWPPEDVAMSKDYSTITMDDDPPIVFKRQAS
jgi:hypothetical protein